MAHLEEAGWRKQKPKKVLKQQVILYSDSYYQAKEITDMDLKAVFRLVDVDKSGSISRTVRLGLNLKLMLNMMLKGGKDGC